MSHIVYIRLPHYVAAYMRNLDPQTPLPAGRPFVIEKGDPLFVDICFRAEPNLRGTVNIDCFSERQWDAMTKGKYLVAADSMRFDMQRDRRMPLTLGEIYTLSGREDRVKRDPDTMELLPDSEYIDEYVPFVLPNVVIRNGFEQKVYPDWYIPNVSYLRSELISRYKMGLLRFVAEDQKLARSNHVPRSRMESIDRFTLRYDIRPGDREREQIKKMLQRSEMTSSLAIDASDIDHSDWSIEDRSEKSERKNAPCRILCLDNGVIYNSIGHFAKTHGVPRSTAETAVKRHTRCHGLRIEKVDD